jgi:hypothetical protein
MIPYGLFTQFLLLIFSGLLAFTYIKPTVADISQAQAKIETYNQEINKVSSVNNTLSSLVLEYNNISSTDRMKLLTYMPDAVDTIAVPRDISAIAQKTGLLVRQISYKGPFQSTGDVVSFDGVMQTSDLAPEPHSFTVLLEGSYAQLKEMLLLMESNAYPLEVNKLSVTEGEGGFLVVDMEVITYDLITPSIIEPALQ